MHTHAQSAYFLAAHAGVECSAWLVYDLGQHASTAHADRWLVMLTVLHAHNRADGR